MEKIALSDFKELMFQKIVPIKGLTDYKGEPMQKIITFWRRHELLPFIEVGKWLEISFMQMIWLRMLDNLREIDFPLKKMQIICDYFFKDAYDNDLPKKNLLYNRSEIKKKIAAGTQHDADEQLLERIEETLKYPKALHILKFDVNYLSNFIAATLSQELEGHIYIFFDGRVREFLGDKDFSHRKEIFNRNDSHICLSVNNYLREFIHDDELSLLFMPQILNDDENKVLKEMRNKNVQEIVIKNNGKDTRIEATRRGTLSAKDAKLIKEILGFGNYERFTIDTLDEKNFSFKRTRKKI